MGCLEDENEQLKQQLADALTDRRKKDEQERADESAKLDRIDLGVQHLNSTVEKHGTMIMDQGRRGKRMEKRLRRGDAQFNSQDHRIKILEADHRERKSLKRHIIGLMWKIAAALGIAGTLAYFGLKEHA